MTIMLGVCRSLRAIALRSGTRLMCSASSRLNMRPFDPADVQPGWVSSSAAPGHTRLSERKDYAAVIQGIGEMANIDVDGTPRLREDLDALVGYLSQVQAWEVQEDTQPLVSPVHEQATPLARDVVGETLAKDDVLRNSKHVYDPYFTAPNLFK
jgi:Asp-tRNA(Asn)/Glu-tRNA(Gln) amidotransferase C subunit